MVHLHWKKIPERVRQMLVIWDFSVFILLFWIWKSISCYLISLQVNLISSRISLCFQYVSTACGSWNRFPPDWKGSAWFWITKLPLWEQWHEQNEELCGRHFICNFLSKASAKVVDNVQVTSIFGNNFDKDEVIKKILAQESSTQCKCKMESTLMHSSVR